MEVLELTIRGVYETVVTDDLEEESDVAEH